MSSTRSTTASPDTTAVREDTFPRLDIGPHCATLTLRRPSQHNRIDPEDIPVITGYLDQLAGACEVRALVITGEGQRTFCSGYTLGEIRTRLDRGFEDMLDRIENLPMPTLCALNGSVYGGGTDMAMCCDLRIGVTGSRMFMPAARFGLHYYPGGLRRFVARIGPVATKRIFVAGQTLDAQEMLRVGYLTELVEPHALQARMHELLENIQEGERGVQVSMKQHIDALAAGTWTEEAGRRAYEASLASPALAQRLQRQGL